jgi:hypothetical protein
MQRRDHLSPAAVVPEFSPDILAILRPAHPSSNYSLRTHTSQKDDTAIAMAEIIMPSSDTPRTTAACVNELMDFILAEWATQHERTHFLYNVLVLRESFAHLYGAHRARLPVRCS